MSLSAPQTTQRYRRICLTASTDISLGAPAAGVDMPGDAFMPLRQLEVANRDASPQTLLTVALVYRRRCFGAGRGCAMSSGRIRAPARIAWTSTIPFVADLTGIGRCASVIVNSRGCAIGELAC
jgi:hypothetical protein